MKMKTLTVLFFMMACLVSASVCGSDTASAKKITGFSQVKKMALKEVNNATIVELDKGYDDGMLVYEVKLIKGKKEYDITYLASDGRMISYGWEKNFVSPHNNKAKVSKSKCRNLALKKVKNGKIISLNQKYDDGVLVYKVKMTQGSKVYELKYHARTGELLEYDWDLHIGKTSDGNSTYIGIEKAKKIALGKVPGGTVVKAEFDKDDGVAVYEIEIVKDNYEYEVKINAKTGKIMEFEKDFND